MHVRVLFNERNVLMHVKIVSLPPGMVEYELAIHIPIITHKAASCYEKGEVWITDGSDEDISKLASNGIVLEKIIPVLT